MLVHGLPLPNAHVTYLDNINFKAFQNSHPDYQPSLEIAAHNSNHVYSMTSTPLIFRHDTQGKERSNEAAKNFHDWLSGDDFGAPANGIYMGCRNKEWIDNSVTFGSYIVKRLMDIFTFGVGTEFVDVGTEYIKSNMEDQIIAHIYSYSHINPATTTITSVELMYWQDEDEDNGIDDDCDGEIDEVKSSSSSSSGGSSSSSSGGSSSSSGGSSSSSSGGSSSSSGGSSSSSSGGNNCVDECSSGEKKCNGYYEGYIVECHMNYNTGCLEWSTTINCSGIKKYCVNGECTY